MRTKSNSQQYVFNHLVLGENNLEIANALSLTEKTVKGHVTKILKKFSCDSRSRLIARHYLHMIQSSEHTTTHVEECFGSYNNGTACMRPLGHNGKCGPPLDDEN